MRLDSAQLVEREVVDGAASVGRADDLPGAPVDDDLAL
jgi:hypothetical protein